MKRSHDSGHLYVKHGSYYGRWRGVDGRLVNKRIGKVRTRGEKDGITRVDAERGLRRLVEAESGTGGADPALVVARTIVFLAGDDSRLVTGETLLVWTAGGAGLTTTFPPRCYDAGASRGDDPAPVRARLELVLNGAPTPAVKGPPTRAG